MPIHEFLAHTTPGKSRIYALNDGDTRNLEAVTTLGATDLEHTNRLISGLNEFLRARDEAALGAVLQPLPDAVQLAVHQFLRERSARDAGNSVSSWSSSDVRLAYFGDSPDELEEYLSAAYLIGLGMKISNEIDEEGDLGWAIQLFTEEDFVPASAELRAWALPPNIEVRATWTSEEANGDPIGTAVAVACEAADQGKWVRLHTLERGSGETIDDGTTTSEVVVDIFEAQIPPADTDA